jgi:hypothetical protein
VRYYWYVMCFQRLTWALGEKNARSFIDILAYAFNRIQISIGFINALLDPFGLCFM